MPSSVPLSISVTCLPTEHLLVLLSGTGYLYIVTLSSGGQVPRGYGGCGHFVSGTDSGLVGWKPFAQQTTACAFSRRCDAVPCELIADLRMWPADSPTELAQPRVADPEVMTHLVNDRPPNLLDDLGIAVAHRPCPGTGEALVGVSASVDEHQQVTIAHLPHSPVQFREVRRAVDEGSDHVALGPRLATEMAGVQSGRVVFRVRSKSGTTASGAAAS